MEMIDPHLTYTAGNANRKLAQIAEASTWTEAMKEEFQRQRFAGLAAEKARLADERKWLKIVCFSIIAIFVALAMIIGGSK